MLLIRLGVIVIMGAASSTPKELVGNVHLGQATSNKQMSIMLGRGGCGGRGKGAEGIQAQPSEDAPQLGTFPASSLIYALLMPIVRWAVTSML